jgi:hypothetical protein
MEGKKPYKSYKKTTVKAEKAPAEIVECRYIERRQSRDVPKVVGGGREV